MDSRVGVNGPTRGLSCHWSCKSYRNQEILLGPLKYGADMPKNIRSKVLAIGRPLRVEIELDGEWLERLRGVLQGIGEGEKSYPLHRYLEELLEADIVYREGDARHRKRFVEREVLIRRLREQRPYDHTPRASANKR